MPILVSIYSQELSLLTNSNPSTVTIIDRLLTKKIYQNKIKTALYQLYPNNKNQIDNIFENKLDKTKYTNIIKDTNGNVIKCSVHIN